MLPALWFMRSRLWHICVFKPVYKSNKHLEKNAFCILSFLKDIRLPSIPTLKIPLISTFDDLDVQVDEEDEFKARGNREIYLNTNSCFRYMSHVFV